MQTGRKRTAKTRLARVAVDRLIIILAFAVKAGANPPHLIRARRVNGLRGFLAGVNAKSSQEIRNAHNSASRLLKPRKQVPIECKLITRIVPPAMSQADLRQNSVSCGT